jgi:transposase
MTTTRTVLRGKDTADGGDLYMSFELGDKQWQMSIGDSHGRVSRYAVGAGDTTAVADCIVKAGKRLRTGAQAQVHSCYEAGRVPCGRFLGDDDLAAGCGAPAGHAVAAA